MDKLINKGFDIKQTAIISCTGVTLYLTREAVADTLKKMVSLAPGSTIAIAFYLPPEQLEGDDKSLMEMSIKGAAASGTPFVSFFAVEEIVQLAEDIGLKEIQTVSTKDMTDQYFKNRADNLIPANGEFFLVAKI
ncbi:hypothetical protein SDC9_183050 [bioreactor metagenome]|uniref:Uncharacterized protein n=1 Tax=bioreactor metagenome TaxID=1076179 RepID=A0A645HB10_9ZZZZ